MSNHFPAVPADAAIAAVRYQIHIDDFGNAASPSPFHFSSPAVNFDSAGYDRAIEIGFSSPGAYGGFDQDTFESSLAIYMNSMCATIAGYLGVSTAIVQSTVVIQRFWSYGSPSDNTAWNGGLVDVMTYPA